MTARAAERAGLAVLALLALALSLHDARRDSATADEPIHAAAGVAEVRTGTWLVNVEHPPLAKAFFGLAAVALEDAEAPRLSYRDLLGSSRDWLFRARPGRPPDAVLLASRTAASLLFALLPLAASFAAGGGLAGLLAAALVVGDTALFPHGHLVTTDVPVTLFAVLTVGALRRLAYGEAGVGAGQPLAVRAAAARSTGPLREDVAWAAVAAVSLAAALASKYTGVLLVPLAAALLAWAARGRGRASRRLLVLALLVPLAASLLLAAGLTLAVRHDPPDALAFLCRLYNLSPGDTALLSAADGVHHGLARYGFGLLFNLRQAEAGRLTYFWDGTTTHPSALYHLVALVVKSPAPWLIAVAAGAFVSLRRGATRDARFLYAAAAFLLAASLPGPRIGVRHVFPAVALLSAGAAAALAPFLPRLRLASRAGVFVFCLAPLVFGRALGAPGLAGRILGRDVLADSNLDWGQDLLRLRALLGERGLAPRDVAIAYFGGDAPAIRIPGIADALAGDERPRRYLAVSRQLLLVGSSAALGPGAAPRAARLLALLREGGAGKAPAPIARAGDSIELFDLGAAPERVPGGGAP